MDLHQRWVIARQDEHAEWEFFADCGLWTTDMTRAVHFYTLWGAEEARIHSAAGRGQVRNAADVYEFAVPLTKSPVAVSAAA